MPWSVVGGRELIQVSQSLLAGILSKAQGGFGRACTALRGLFSMRLPLCESQAAAITIEDWQ